MRTLILEDDNLAGALCKLLAEVWPYYGLSSKESSLVDTWPVIAGCVRRPISAADSLLRK